MVLDNVQQLKTVINRIRSDPAQSTNPLTMKLNGTLDAAVNGGVSKFDVCVCVCARVCVVYIGLVLCMPVGLLSMPPHLSTSCVTLNSDFELSPIDISI